MWKNETVDIPTFNDVYSHLQSICVWARKVILQKNKTLFKFDIQPFQVHSF
jgi:hypothetical protein